MDTAERVATLEQRVFELQAQGEQNQEILQRILSKIDSAIPTNQTPPPQPSPRRLRSPATPNTSSGGTSRRTPLRPANPPDYDGDRRMGKAFLTACRTYIRLCPDAFEDEATQIIWALSFMKTGRANRWAERVFEREQLDNGLPFTDWLDFEDEFRRDFTPLNAESAAVNKLEGTSYFQQNRSVDDYLDEFRELIHDSGYTDPKTIVVKFRRGLDRRISSALAGMATGRPMDTDPERWFELAVQMDQNRAADEAFLSSHRAPPSSQSAPRPGNKGGNSVLMPPPRFAHVKPSPGNPVPMDIDAARKKVATPDTCRRCGETGHWSKNCPHRFDVRLMDSDELQTFLENKLASLDVAQEESALDEEAPKDAEDF